MSNLEKIYRFVNEMIKRKNLNVLELFSGNADITKEIRILGANCTSVDWEDKYLPDICMDVYKIDADFLRRFDAIWLSPDCTTYSIASHGKYRYKGGVPKLHSAWEQDYKNEKLFKMLKDLDIPFIAENPRGFLRHMEFMKDLNRVTVYYSSYGAKVTKPTDLFSNRDISSFFNTKISRGDTPLDYVVPNSRNFLERCKIPYRLVRDIAHALIILAGERKYENQKIGK